MKVRCKFCEHFSGGYCTKQKKGSSYLKVKANKPRTCSIFEEDGLTILDDFRKKERHKAVLKKQEEIRRLVEQAQRKLEERKTATKLEK